MEECLKEHWNLYYIFQADKEEHFMPENRAEQIRLKILDRFDTGRSMLS